MDVCQTFLIGASWDKDELIRFWGQKVKGQGHIRWRWRRPALDAPSVEFRFLVHLCFAFLRAILSTVYSIYSAK